MRYTRPSGLLYRASLVGALVLLAVGSASAQSAAAPFPHRKHAETPCAACHLFPDEQKNLALNATGCGADGCHQDAPAPTGYAPLRSRLSGAFPHHYPAHKLPCGECHLPTLDVAGPAVAAIKANRCMECHEKKVAAAGANPCAPCHVEQQPKAVPGWHDAEWAALHGPRMHEGGFDFHARECGQCHEIAFCMDCHQIKKPMFHRQHLEERGAECTDCHVQPKGDEAPAVSKTGCKRCHPGDVQAEILQARARRMPSIAFPHRPHVPKVPCKDCHLDTMMDRTSEDAPMVARVKCEDCHEDRDANVPDAFCAPCHGKDLRGIAPSSHKLSWPVRHNVDLDRRMPAHERDCALCHNSGTCRDCHQTVRPRTHTSLWRDRTHGLAASWDRDACRTCHEPGSCVACHRETKPLNHRGAWRAIHGLAAQVKDNAQCSACHDLSWCADCHAGRGR